MSSPHGGPMVSVIVPTYNSAPFVAETISSILSQSFTDFELIISDHSSTDGTWEVLQLFTVDPRVRLLRAPRTDAPHDNWNHATAVACGQFLKLVCADDLLSADCLEIQVEAMQSNSRAVMVASRRSVITSSGEVVLRSWGLPGITGEVQGTVAVRESVRSGTNIFGEPACVLLRRRTLQSIGGWDGSFPYVLDQHTYSKMLMYGTFVGIEAPLASFRLSEAQWSMALARKQYDQVIEFHKAIATTYPHLLSRADLWNGRWRAKMLTAGRRLTYFVLARKMKRMHATRTAFGGAMPRSLSARAEFK